MGETMYKRSTATKEKLLTAVAKLAKEKGYANVTIRDICKESGVSNGSFYYHFPSKDALALESCAHIDNRMTSELAEICNALPPDESLHFLLRVHIDFTLERSGLLTGEYFKLILEKKADTIFCTSRPYYQMIHSQLVRCQTAGLIGPELSIDTLTAYSMQFVRGLVFDWCIHHGSYSLADQYESVYPLFATGFMKSEFQD